MDLLHRPPKSPSIRRVVRARVEGELACVVLLALALNLWGITWGLPNAGDWAVDSVAPLGPLLYAQRMFESAHWWSKYPPLHLTLLALVSAPYVALLWLTGAFEPGSVLYPYGFAHPEIALPTLFLIARGMSAAMGVGAAVAAYLIARELAGRRAGFFAGLLFASSPLAIYYAHTGNLDMPYMFWSSLALLCLVRVARGAPLATHVWLGVFTAAAIATKDQAYGLFLLMPLPLLVRYARRSDCRPIHAQSLLAGLVTAVVTYLLAANVLIDFAGWCAHLNYITHEGSIPYQMFPATPPGYLALAGRTLRLTVETLSVPAALLATLGIIRALAYRPVGAGVLVFAACSYAALFLGPILYVLPRFVMPIVFVLAIFGGMAAALLWESSQPLARGAVLAVLAYILSYGVSMNLGLLWDSRYAAEQWLAMNLPSDAVVGTDGGPVYLPRLPPNVTTVAITMAPTGPIAFQPTGRSKASTPAGRITSWPPDYLILSDAHYRRYFRRDELRMAIELLLAGRLDYEPVAIFYQGGLPATDLIPTVNPRIVVLRRREEHRPAAALPREQA
jgi:4-amino-4-deoxy-L-arabinose transferase-like glycosyltransferase